MSHMSHQPPMVQMMLVGLKNLLKNKAVLANVDKEFVTLIVQKICNILPRTKNYEDRFLDIDLNIVDQGLIDTDSSLDENMKKMEIDENKTRAVPKMIVVLVTLLQKFTKENPDVSEENARRALNRLATECSEDKLASLCQDQNQYGRDSYIRGSLNQIKKEKKKVEANLLSINTAPERAAKVFRINKKNRRCFDVFMDYLAGKEISDEKYWEAMREAVIEDHLDGLQLELKRGFQDSQREFIVVLALCSFKRSQHNPRPCDRFIAAMKDLLQFNSIKHHEKFLGSLRWLQSPLIIRPEQSSPDDRPPPLMNLKRPRIN